MYNDRWVKRETLPFYIYFKKYAKEIYFDILELESTNLIFSSR